jgi:CRP-like cAMP-binding protein
MGGIVLPEEIPVVCKADFNGSMLRMMQQRLDAKDRRIEGFLTKDAAGRYLDFFEDFPGLEGRIPQYYVASYLGITPSRSAGSGLA